MVTASSAHPVEIDLKESVSNVDELSCAPCCACKRLRVINREAKTEMNLLFIPMTFFYKLLIIFFVQALPLFHA
jgi:hypothetical protein